MCSGWVLACLSLASSLALAFGSPTAEARPPALSVQAAGLLKSPQGIIATIPPGSAAEAAGLQVGDRILAADGDPITFSGYFKHDTLMQRAHDCRLTIGRGQSTVDITLPQSKRASFITPDFAPGAQGWLSDMTALGRGPCQSPQGAEILGACLYLLQGEIDSGDGQAESLSAYLTLARQSPEPFWQVHGYRRNGETLEGVGDLKAAMKAHEKATSLLPENSLTPLMAYAASGGITSALQLGQLEDAARYARQEEAVWSRWSPGSLAHASALNTLGNISLEAESPAAGLAYYEASMEILEIRKPGGPEVAAVQNNLGSAAWAVGDWAGALAHYERSIALKDALGQGPAAKITTLINLGVLASDLNQDALALDYASQVESFYQSTDPGGLEHGVALSTLGNLMIRSDPGAARPLLEEAHRILTQVAPGGSMRRWCIRIWACWPRQRGS